MEVGKSGRVSPECGVASQDIPGPFTNYTFSFLEVCQKRALGVCGGGWMCVGVWMCVSGCVWWGNDFEFQQHSIDLWGYCG